MGLFCIGVILQRMGGLQEQTYSFAESYEAVVLTEENSWTLCSRLWF